MQVAVQQASDKLTRSRVCESESRVVFEYIFGYGLPLQDRVLKKRISFL